ncbi:MAG: bifunctional riboflavin kinase/FAD synthetase [Alphaproteobacteria bacterium]|nr:bifunctional riboflavin kinase/FAD synthetase [Alphaproteobacteria bacterium]
MRIIRHTETLPRELAGAVVAIGNFDGVHRGHQAVMGQARDIATGLGAPVVALTFEPHPRSLFQPDSEPFRLTTLRSKAHHLEELGIDGMVVLHFDQAFAAKSAEDFIAEILVKGLAARHIVVGEDFAFGRGRAGNVDLLKSMAAASGFDVTPAVQIRDEDGSTISSNTIRVFLRDGRPEAATRLLGRPWEVDGRVIHGDGRGVDLGFPTANVRMEGCLLPRPGVYAVRAGIDAGVDTKWLDGAANFGVRPQFDGVETRLEVFLMDYSGDLYGRTLRVAFIAFLRPEAAFEDIDALISQMERDVAEARRLLTPGS